MTKYVYSLPLGTRRGWLSVVSLVLVLAIPLAMQVAPLFGQDFRATLTGLVTDPSGAAVPGATVKANNIDTKETREVKTTADGHYTIPYLNPGIYNVEFTASGFQTLKRERIVLRVADKVDLSAQLTIGSVTQEVVVVAHQEVIEAGSADRGLVFDPIKTQGLPLNGRQTYMLLSLTPGVIFTTETFGPNGNSGTRGWDVTSSYKINGARPGQNVFLLNGAPISDNGGTWQLAPNVEAVQEFKVMTNTYDAQYGRFGGGVVNTTTKSGTHEWHGDVFEYFRNKVFDANYFQNKLAVDPVSGQAGARTPQHNQHQWGGVVGGPIRKQKDFIFGSFEGWREIIGVPSLSSVPPNQLRQVDPTLLNGAGGINFGALGYKIYDPLTTHPCTPGSLSEPCTGPKGASFWRTEFAGDILPANRINPIGRKILSYYPAANVLVDPVTGKPKLDRNFVASANIARYRYDQPMFRWDHVFSESDKLYTLFTFQHGREYRDSTGFGPPAGSGDVGSERTDQNYVAGWTHVLSPIAVLDVRGSFGRFTSMFPRYTDFNLTADQVGMTGMIQAPTFGKKTVPLIQVGGYTTLFALASANTLLSWTTYNQWNLAPSVTMTRSNHTLHTGFEVNYVARGSNSYGWSNGNFSFGQFWTQQNDSRNQGTFDGSGLASLLLGTPSADGNSVTDLVPNSIDWNASAYRTRPYFGFFVQDDWKLSPRLTLNLGLRYEVQIAWLERFNRAARGFDTVNVNPLSSQLLNSWAAAKTAWTACASDPTDAKCSGLGVNHTTATQYPYPTPPAVLKGGYVFPGVNGQPSRLYDTDWTNLAPRVGVAWRIAGWTVLRAGAGVYYQSPTQLGVVAGFSQFTPYTTTLNGIKPSACFDPTTFATSTTCMLPKYSLQNPFPNGLNAPAGSSLGLQTSVGNNVSFDPSRYKIPRTYQYSFGFQHELPHGILAEVSFAGNYQTYVESTFNQNRWSFDDNSRGIQDNNWLNLPLPNPFFGILPSTSTLGGSPTLSRQNLLRPGAVFQDVTNNLVQAGRYRSDALQVKIEKRVLGGGSTGMMTWVVSYTLAKAYEQNHRLNNWSAQEPLIYELDNNDKTHNFAISGLWDLPFGKNRKFLSSNPVASAVAGNWRLHWIFTYLSGYPVTWPNQRNLCGDWHAAVQDENHWFNNDKTNCIKSLPPFTVRTLPDRFPDIRNPTAPQLNIAGERTFHFNERYRLQFRAEAFNVTNTPVRDRPVTTFSSASFGQLPKQQINYPRVMQLAAKLYF